ncbi:GGDEF domain-containing protein [Secundilactobacillus collinoides]|uniref:Signal transduction diguanylate cyclase n=1 Tax=Secundilactobacillus collinoides DSM 20515 = JCM 1123 TaxID=1423733 RepID=A0A0R2BFQ8_SECCO|nr:GGDEF domain-containing protein [Secundilactobacillus collinoides]KRM77712.1 Signal transduction diguanylate cyclase [Secundilactobacillus collinoides DSM 20515 = JCM 1123]
MTVFQLSTSQWFIDLVLSLFFITGYNSIYVSLWHHAYEDTRAKNPHNIWSRLSVFGFCFAASLFIYLVRNMIGMPMITFDLLIFMLTIPLLAIYIDVWDYVIRFLGLALFLVVTHQFSISFVIGMGVLVVLSILNWIYRKQIAYHQLLPRILFCLYIACLFWLPLKQPNNDAISQPILVQAIAMSLAITIVSGLFLLIQYGTISHDWEMTRMADYDALTDAKNYSMYTRDVTPMFQQAKTHDEPLTLVTLDVDHFKNINDTYGHLAGNEVLVGVANTLRRVLSSQDEKLQIYRTGGEEFNIVFPNMTTAEVVPIIEDCWQSVRGAKFDYKGYKIHVTISMGVTALRSEDQLIDDTYRRADQSLYISKHEGRDTITVEGHAYQRSSI